MSTHLPEFQSFSRIFSFHHFVLAKLAPSSIRVKKCHLCSYLMGNNKGNFMFKFDVFVSL